MIAMIGQMRPYKGIELAIEAVARLNGPQLLLAGQATESVNLEDLPDCVHVVNRHITEQEVADFMAASDLALFPYRKITGSGALMLAITFERPFVAADLPYFREAHRRAPSAGALFRTGDADACAQAIETMLARPASQSAEQLSKLHSSLNWNSAVLPFVRRLAGL